MSRDPIVELVFRNFLADLIPDETALRLLTTQGVRYRIYSFLSNDPLSGVDMFGLAHVVNNTSFRVFIVYNAWLSKECIKLLEKEKGITLRDGVNGMPGVIPPGTDTQSGTLMSDVDGYWILDSATAPSSGMNAGTKIRYGKKDLTDTTISQRQLLAHGETAQSSLADLFSGGNFSNHVNMWKNDYRLTVVRGISTCECTQKDLNLLDHMIRKAEQAIAEFPSVK